MTVFSLENDGCAGSRVNGAAYMIVSHNLMPLASTFLSKALSRHQLTGLDFVPTKLSALCASMKPSLRIIRCILHFYP